MKHVIVALLIILSTTADAQQQQQQEEPAEVWTEAIVDESMETFLADPSLRSPVFRPKVAVELGFSSGDNRSASAVISSDLLKTDTLDLGAHLKLSTPVGKTTTEASLVDLSGLTGTTKIELGFEYSSARKLVKETFTRWTRSTGFTRNQAAFQTTTSSSSYDAIAAEIERVADAVRVDRSAFASAATTRDPLDFGYPWVASVLGSWGRKSFTFRDGMTFAEQKASRELWGVQVATGVTRLYGTDKTARWYLGGSFKYEDTSSAQPTRNLCIPTGTSGVLECSDAAVGAPKQKTSQIFEAEYRRFLGDHYGINPKIQFDARSSTFGVQLPLYVRQDPAKGLTGGISAGWRSDSRQLTAFVFVGAFPTMPGRR